MKFKWNISIKTIIKYNMGEKKGGNEWVFFKFVSFPGVLAKCKKNVSHQSWKREDACHSATGWLGEPTITELLGNLETGRLSIGQKQEAVSVVFPAMGIGR